MVKTYIRAPNWSTAPPPDGPLRLGHLLSSLDEFSPVNAAHIVPILNENPVDIKNGFTLNLRKAKSGELGVFAKFLALAGIGFESSVSYEQEEVTELGFRSLETLSFIPDGNYIKKVSALEDTTSYLQNSRWSKSLFLVTGIKVGRGGYIRTSELTGRGVAFEVGISTPGVPVEIGPKFNINSSTSGGELFTGSSDFIVAFQVRKLHWRRGRVSHGLFKEKAELHGETDAWDAEDMDEWELEVSEDVSALDFVQYSGVWEGKESEDQAEEETSWIIPEED